MKIFEITWRDHSETVVAETAGKAKYDFFLQHDIGDSMEFGDFIRRVECRKVYILPPDAEPYQSGLKSGDTVKMVNCFEAEKHADKVWVVCSEPWKLGHGEEVILLEGYIGGFATKCLQTTKD